LKKGFSKIFLKIVFKSLFTFYVEFFFLEAKRILERIYMAKIKRKVFDKTYLHQISKPCTQCVLKILFFLKFPFSLQHSLLKINVRKEDTLFGRSVFILRKKE